MNMVGSFFILGTLTWQKYYYIVIVIMWTLKYQSLFDGIIKRLFLIHKYIVQEKNNISFMKESLLIKCEENIIPRDIF